MEEAVDLRPQAGESNDEGMAAGTAVSGDLWELWDDGHGPYYHNVVSGECNGRSQTAHPSSFPRCFITASRASYRTMRIITLYVRRLRQQ